MKIIPIFIKIIYLLAHKHVPLRLKLIFLPAILYFLWPRDALMDFSVGVGLIDDFLLLLLLSGIFIKVASKRLDQEVSSNKKSKIIEAKYKVVDENRREK